MNKLNLLILLWEKLFKNQQKQSKIMEEKQIDALADLKPKEVKPRETKPNKYGDYFLDGLAKIRESYKPIDFNDLIYNFKDSRITSVDFIKFKGPFHIFKSIHNSDIPLEDIEKEQTELKRDFITQEKKLLKCLMIMLGTCIEIFMIQNKKEQGLKY